MANQLSALEVFIASPSDVQDERLAFRDAVDTLNRSISELGWTLRVLGWEDTLPGYQRPQELINADVDRADIFVGLLWRRWGQPTGEYTSGFEEEFARARERNAATGTPEIWLFFKAIPDEFLTDPGPQLQRVLDFRDLQIRENAGLFKEFDDTDTWRDMLQEYLLRYVLQHARASVSAPEESPPSPSDQPRTSTSAEAPPQEEFANTAEAFEAATAALLQSTEFVPTEDIGVDRSVIARIYLAAAAWMSYRYTTELAPAHELNVAYLERHAILPTNSVKHFIARTLFGSTEENVAGWFWFAGYPSDWWSESGSALYLRDGAATVRTGYLRALAAAHERLPRQGPIADALPHLLSDRNASVRKAAAAYLETIEPSQAIEVLSAAPLKTTPEWQSTHTIVLSQHDPPAAFGSLLEGEIEPSPHVSDSLMLVAREVPEDLVRSALGDRRPEVRRLAIDLLDRSRKLRRSDFDMLRSDAAPVVRDRIASIAARKNWRISPDEMAETLSASELSADAQREITSRMLKHLDYDDLSGRIGWLRLDGPEAYEVRAVKWSSQLADDVRSDLESEFERLRDTLLKSVEAGQGEAARDDLVKQISPRVDTYVRDRYKAAALRALATAGTGADVEVGRRYLHDPDRDVSRAALSLVARFGDATDAASLVEVASTSIGSLQREAGEAALTLDPTSAPMALIATDVLDLVLAGIAAATLDEDEERGKLGELLYHDDPRVRRSALRVLIGKLSRSEQEALLEAYPTRRYFYNVVHWLDRILYAPPPLRTAWRKEL